MEPLIFALAFNSASPAPERSSSTFCDERSRHLIFVLPEPCTLRSFVCLFKLNVVAPDPSEETLGVFRSKVALQLPLRSISICESLLICPSPKISHAPDASNHW